MTKDLAFGMISNRATTSRIPVKAIDAEENMIIISKLNFASVVKIASVNQSIKSIHPNVQEILILSTLSGLYSTRLTILEICCIQ